MPQTLPIGDKGGADLLDCCARRKVTSRPGQRGDPRHLTSRNGSHAVQSASRGKANCMSGVPDHPRRMMPGVMRRRRLAIWRLPIA